MPMLTPEIFYQTAPQQQIFIRWKSGYKSLGLGALIVLALAPLSAQAGSEEGLIYVLKPMTATKVTIARQGYFPRLDVLPNDELLSVFKMGAGHVGKHGYAGLSRSSDGGMTWTEPVKIFDLPKADDGVDAHGVLRDGTILYGAVSYGWEGERYSYKNWYANTYIIRSQDQGHTWSEPAKVNIAPFTWAYPFGRIIELADGQLLMTMYGGYLPLSLRGPAAKDKDDVTREMRKLGDQKPEQQRGDFAFIIKSKDGGKTWGDLHVIARGFNETCPVLLPNQRILVAMRSTEGGAYTATSYSDDDGNTWSVPVQISSQSEHPADLLLLKSGELLLTHGQRNKPYGVQVMVSKDNGTTWGANRIMLAWDGDHMDLGYPVTVQRKDGKLVTAYYIVYGQKNKVILEGPAPEEAYIKGIIWDPVLP
ncbi:MAG: exo-alpha-sialidase [Opitutaceae bacterium]|nr:exo-alpha-sialidase [Opitutaceae bacterium]